MNGSADPRLSMLAAVVDSWEVSFELVKVSFFLISARSSLLSSAMLVATIPLTITAISACNSAGAGRCCCEVVDAMGAGAGTPDGPWVGTSSVCHCDVLLVPLELAVLTRVLCLELLLTALGIFTAVNDIMNFVLDRALLLSG